MTGMTNRNSQYHTGGRNINNVIIYDGNNRRERYDRDDRYDRSHTVGKYPIHYNPNKVYNNLPTNGEQNSFSYSKPEKNFNNNKLPMSNIQHVNKNINNINVPVARNRNQTVNYPNDSVFLNGDRSGRLIEYDRYRNVRDRYMGGY